MEQFLGFALPGIPFGCTYAIVAVGLVLTYQATGVFNFAFGAQAFAAAFVFTLLTQNEHWSGFPSFLVSVVVMSPLIGLAFDHFLFRHIRLNNKQLFVNPHASSMFEPGARRLNFVMALATPSAIIESTASAA